MYALALRTLFHGPTNITCSPFHKQNCSSPANSQLIEWNWTSIIILQTKTKMWSKGKLLVYANFNILHVVKLRKSIRKWNYLYVLFNLRDCDYNCECVGHLSVCSFLFGIHAHRFSCQQNNVYDEEKQKEMRKMKNEKKEELIEIYLITPCCVYICPIRFHRWRCWVFDWTQNDINKITTTRRNKWNRRCPSVPQTFFSLFFFCLFVLFFQL